MADTPKYIQNLRTLVNPDLSAVQNIPTRDWKVEDGKTVRRRTSQEKDLRLSAELAEKDTQADAGDFDPDLMLRAIVSTMSDARKKEVMLRYKTSLRS